MWFYSRATIYLSAAGRIKTWAGAIWSGASFYINGGRLGTTRCFATNARSAGSPPSSGLCLIRSILPRALGVLRNLLIERTRSKQARNKAPRAPDSQPALRNYLSGKQPLSAEELLVDRAQLLTLTAPEMTVPSRGSLQLYSKASRLA